MTEDPIRKEVDALKADISHLRADIAALTNALKEVASDKIDDTKAQARQTAQGSWEEIERKFDEVLQQGRDAVDNVEQGINKHPSGSLLAAFGIGFIIAKLLDTGGRH
ncbi:MAG: hypothetical protein QNL62_00040 [Gammaproteobacteria bacterium]|nr:hypothetical protein [Gammaproteobacteria bacterium]